jgi:ABC-type bacteriocin/lantibiotic exporter with double-glycine peptidase domain
MIRKIHDDAYVGKALFIALIGALAALSQFVFTWYLGKVIDAVAVGLDAVLRNALVIGLAVLAFLLCNTLYIGLSGKMTQQLLFSIRCKLAKRICSAEYEKLIQVKDGDILTILSNDVETIAPWLTATHAIGTIIIYFVTGFAGMIAISWKLFCVALFMLPVALLPKLFLSGKLHGKYVAESEAVSKASGYISEALNLIVVLKAFCMESASRKKNHEIAKQWEDISRNRAKYLILIDSISRCIGKLGNPIVFIVGAFFILRGEMTIGQIISNMFLIDLIGKGINLLNELPTSYRGATAAIERFQILLDLPEENDASMAEAVSRQGDVVYRLAGIGYHYQQNTVLRDVNLCIHRGEKIALIGKSGGGKSTLLKILCGLLHASEGTIELYGNDMRRIAMKDIRQLLSVAPQESFLISDTIASNIKMAAPESDKAQVIEACHKATLSAWIESLPGQYETPLTGAIHSLSNGQMQRLNLARVFARDTDIWLLDEPTSALDNAARDEVLGHLLGNPNHTLVAIVHDLEICAHFDRVFMVNDGCLQEVTPEGATDEA